MNGKWTVTLTTTNNSYVNVVDALYLVGAEILTLSAQAQDEEAENYQCIVEIHVA